MIFLRIFTLIAVFFAFCSAHIEAPFSQQSSDINLEPMSENFERLFDMVMSADSDWVYKRDALLDNLEGILTSIKDSGVIFDVLHEIANSTEEMNTLANYIYKALVSALTSTAIGGFNFTINATDIIAKVNDSGIITDTMYGLLFDEEQRNILTDNLGEILLNNTWIPMLISNTGATGVILWETIFEIARTVKCQDKLFTGASITTKYQQVIMGKRDDSGSNNYTGSLLSFVNNVVGSALNSDLFGESLESVLVAVKNSGIIVPTVQEILADQKVQQMVGYIANKLYNYGVFDQIPINKLFQEQKKSGNVSRLIQKLFSLDTSSYVLGNIFLRLEQKGVYEQMFLCLWGKKKTNSDPYSK